MKKLPEDFKKKWIDALRSGEYKQGKNHLVIFGNNNEPYYCCLGVAGKVCGLSDIDLRFQDFFTQTHVNNLPDLLFGEDNVPAMLAKMNDDDNMSFNKIADYIEKEL
jgi:hypothetical protein